MNWRPITLIRDLLVRCHNTAYSVWGKRDQSEEGISQWKKTLHIDGLVQERRDSSALVKELRFPSINPLLCNSFSRRNIIESHT